MSYTFLDAYSSVQSADSSLISATVQRPKVDIASVLTALPVTLSGNLTVQGVGAPTSSVISNPVMVGGVDLLGSSVIGLRLSSTGITLSSVVGGSLSVLQLGTWKTSIYTGIVGSSVVSAVSSTIGIGASIIGLAPVNIIGSPSISGAVTIVGTSIPPGSIAGTVQISGNPSISGTVNIAGNPSISGTVNIAGNPSISGTVNAIESGLWKTSVLSTQPSSFLVGNYAQRNDSLASFLGGDLVLGPNANDSAGRLIIKPFVSDDGTTIRFTSSTVSTSVMLIQASAVGKRNYVTDFWFANTGAATTLVTIRDGSTSVLAYTIVPTTGGSNSQGIHVPIRTAPAQDLTIAPATATSVLYVTVNGYQAP